MSTSTPCSKAGSTSMCSSVPAASTQLGAEQRGGGRDRGGRAEQRAEEDPGLPALPGHGGRGVVVEHGCRVAGRRPAARPTAGRRAAPTVPGVETSEWLMPWPAVIRFSSPGRTIAWLPALSRCSISPVNSHEHRLQPGVRVRRDAHPAGVGDVVGPVVVEEAPGADQRALPLRQGAAHRHRPRAAEGYVAGRHHLDARRRVCLAARARRVCPRGCSRGHRSGSALVDRVRRSLVAGLVAVALLDHAVCGGRPGCSSRMITDFEVGVLLPSALESSGTSGLVSG